MANRLISAAWGPVNISAAAVIYTYTATVSSFVQIQAFISDAAGGGDYVWYIRKQRAGAGVNFVMGPKTTATHAAGETGIGSPTILLYCHIGDVVQVYVDGLAGDVACNGFIEVIELDYLLLAADALTAAALDTSAVNEIVAAIVADAYFAGITSLADWLGALAGMTTDAATLAEINATTAGATYNNTTDSLEALRNWLSAATTISAVSVIAGGRITVRPYSTWTISVSGVGSLVGRTSLWFGVKDDPAIQADASSFLQVEETAGLQYINGAVGVGANATLVVTDPVAGNFTVTVNKSQTGVPPCDGRVWQLKMGIAGGADTIIAEGEFNVGQTVTRTTA